MFIVIYTVKTTHELGEIPLYCPLNYDYKFAQLHFICQLRTSNLIFMWMASMSVLYAWVRTLVPEFKGRKNRNYKNDANDEDDEGGKEYSEEEKQDILEYIIDMK